MKNVNAQKAIQWIIFSPILIPISLVSGAFYGLNKAFKQASSDIKQAA